MIKLLILAVMNNCTLFTISLQKFATYMITLEHGGRGVDTDLYTIEDYVKLYFCSDTYLLVVNLKLDTWNGCKFPDLNKMHIGENYTDSDDADDTDGMA